MKISFLVIGLFLVSAGFSQSLRDSLYGGKLKADTGKTVVSTDTSKYVVRTNEVVRTNATISSQPGEKKNTEVIKPDESMPDSLNKLFYSKQKLFKRFIEMNTQIVSQAADDTRKVKKGEYSIEIEYEIGLNGKVATTGITCNPNNAFLIEQVTAFMSRPPVLSPPIYSDGKPKKLLAKQPITIVKK
jgi:hypothetical protein